MTKLVRVRDTESVLDAARRRVAHIFDNFDKIVTSVSGGKDSTVIFYLALEEAERRGRTITAFYLDQEAEYASTIDVIEGMMMHPNVVPAWYQVPILMTNATSYSQEFLNAWGPGEKWMREKSPLAIHEAPGAPDRFYDFFHWAEKQSSDTAFLIGLRAEEGINRVRATIKNPGYDGIPWSTKTKSPTSFRFYPIYDWGMGDVWRYIRDGGYEYNALYDRMVAANHGHYNTMRVSNLIHEKSFSCLTYLQEFEPETFDRLVERLGGVHVASIYAKEHIYTAAKLPEGFASWKDYRDYLLETSPLSRRERFDKRFAGQEQSEDVFRQQCRQIMTNDWENNLAPIQNKAVKRAADLEKWRAIL